MKMKHQIWVENMVNIFNLTVVEAAPGERHALSDSQRLHVWPR